MQSNDTTTGPQQHVGSTAELGYFKLFVTCTACGISELADRDNADPRNAVEIRSLCSACGGGVDAPLIYIDKHGLEIEQPNHQSASACLR